MVQNKKYKKNFFFTNLKNIFCLDLLQILFEKQKNSNKILVDQEFNIQNNDILPDKHDIFKYSYDDSMYIHVDDIEYTIPDIFKTNSILALFLQSTKI